MYILLTWSMLVGHLVMVNAYYYPKFYIANYCENSELNVIQLKDSVYYAGAKVRGHGTESGQIEANVICYLTVKPADGQQIAFHVHKLFVDQLSAILKIQDSNTGAILLTSLSSEDDPFVTDISSSGPLLISLETNDTVTSDQLDLDIILTSFIATADCPLFWYLNCGQGSYRCVREHFRCDGVNNCGNSYDEKHCKEMTITSLVIVMMAILACLVMVVAKTFRRILKGVRGRDRQASVTSVGAIVMQETSLAGDDVKPLLKESYLN
ncbi:hypothetical protein HDE_07766 [Halotydeus destructor]|nr:hypothetical protein HDE_07766 [Halotydeus destructor]